MSEAAILHEQHPYHIIQNPKTKAYEVCRHENTHSVVVATIGASLGLDRAITELNNRLNKAQS